MTIHFKQHGELYHVLIDNNKNIIVKNHENGNFKRSNIFKVIMKYLKMKGLL